MDCSREHPELYEYTIGTLVREVMEEACVSIRDIEYLGAVEVIESNEKYYLLRFMTRVKQVHRFKKEWETNERKFVKLNDLKNKYNIEFTVVGDGPEFNNLKVKYDDIMFKGMVSNPKKYYKEADIFVTPSKFGEGLQGTILEAMSCGLTIVATDTDINRELLNEGRVFLVKPELVSLKEGIINAINANRDEISLKNRNYVLEKYDWIEKCNEILEDVK